MYNHSMIHRNTKEQKEIMKTIIHKIKKLFGITADTHEEVTEKVIAHATKIEKKIKSTPKKVYTEVKKTAGKVKAKAKTTAKKVKSKTKQHKKK